MAVTAFKRAYGQDTPAYEALVADLTNALEWTKVEDDTAEKGTTSFYMLNDAAGEHAIRVTVTNAANAAPSVELASSNATGEYVPSWSSSVPFRGEYANFAIWEGGFCVEFSREPLPASAEGVAGFGVVRGTRADGTANKWCCWGASTSANALLLFVGSDDTHNNSTASRTVHYNAEFTAARPLYTPYSTYVLDDVLMLDMTQDSHTKLCGFCELNGKRYYRNGAVLIPSAEE